MKKNLFLAGVAGLAATVMSSRAAEQRRPNVIFMLVDDQECGDINCFGGKALTPNIDRLMDMGVKLTRCYATTSVCTPSRYSCLTGQYASRCKSPMYLAHNPPGTQSYTGWNTTLEMDGPNLARVLKANGYATGMVGKWHLGSDEKNWAGTYVESNPRFKKWPRNADYYAPEVQEALRYDYPIMQDLIRQRGFDYVEGLYWDNPHGFKLEGLNHNQEWITDAALKFIEQNKDRPFYLHFCCTPPHGPWDDLREIDPLATPAGLIEKAPNVQPSRGSVYERIAEAHITKETGWQLNRTAAFTWLDDAIGALVSKLEELDLLDNTLIVYFSDNPRLEKGLAYEPGARVPAGLIWKGHLPGHSEYDGLSANIDFVPTIFSALKIQPPKDMHIDGIDLAPVVVGKQKGRDYLFMEMSVTRALATKDWKYITVNYPEDMDERIAEHRGVYNRYHGLLADIVDKRAEKVHPDYWDNNQLYNLEQDPKETENLYDDPESAGTVRDVRRAMKDWLKTFDRPFGELTGNTVSKPVEAESVGVDAGGGIVFKDSFDGLNPLSADWSVWINPSSSGNPVMTDGALEFQRISSDFAQAAVQSKQTVDLTRCKEAAFRFDIRNFGGSGAGVGRGKTSFVVSECSPVLDTLYDKSGMDSLALMVEHQSINFGGITRTPVRVYKSDGIGSTEEIGYIVVNSTNDFSLVLTITGSTWDLKAEGADWWTPGSSSGLHGFNVATWANGASVRMESWCAAGDRGFGPAAVDAVQIEKR